MSSLHDLALIFSPKWSINIARDIFAACPDRAILFTASEHELHSLLPEKAPWREAFLAWRRTCSLEHFALILQEKNIHTVTRNEPAYPKLLQYIAQPPLLLFVQGNIPKHSAWCAVVGSRDATAYGKEHAFRISKELAEHDQGIVSGLARGIDESAIRGACSVKGSAVIAVLAGGHTHMSKRERMLADLIIAHGGAVVSEHTPRFQPQGYHFPIRNRIIAGIAQKTVVIEAAIKSGSLHTAQSALTENRDVFALPGLITSPLSAGCHKLIQEGAGLCTSVYDILEIPAPQSTETPPGLSLSLTEPQQRPPHTQRALPPHYSSPLHEKLWNLLKEPRTFDSLVEYAGEKSPQVAGILNIWEIEGYLTLNHGHFHLLPL